MLSPSKFLDNTIENFPLQLNALPTNIKKFADELKKQFSVVLKSAQNTLHGKRLERQHLLASIASELKPPTKEIKEEELLKKLPELISAKITASKLELLALLKKAENTISDKTKAALATNCKGSLKEIEKELARLQSEEKLSELKKQLDDYHDEDKFIGNLCKNVAEENAARDLAKKRALAEEAKRNLEEAKDNEAKAKIGRISLLPAAAERERLIAERQLRMASLDEAKSASNLKTIHESPISTPKYTEISYAKGIAAALLSMIAAPIAWVYGSYQFGKENGVGLGLLVFLVAPIGWFFGGMRIGQWASGEMASQQNQPISSPDSPIHSPKKSVVIPGIKLPTTTFQDQPDTSTLQAKLLGICSVKKIDYKQNGSTLSIGTSPLKLSVDNSDTMSVQTKDKAIKFSPAAAKLMCNILYDITVMSDLTIDIDRGLIKLSINAGNVVNSYCLSAGNTSDHGLLWGYERIGSDTTYPLKVSQFTGDNLKSLLYQNPGLAEIKQHNTDHGQPKGDEPKFNFRR